MSEKSFDDFLKQQLHNRHHYIDDGDFTAQVMANLPAPHRLNLWLEKLIVILPATLITLYVLGQLPWRDWVHQGYAWVLTFDSASLISLAMGILVVTLAVPVCWFLRKSSLI